MEPTGVERHRRSPQGERSTLAANSLANWRDFAAIQAIRGSRGKKVFTFFETVRIFFLCKGMNPKEGKLLKERNP
jgi:hypothetical protein